MMAAFSLARYEQLIYSLPEHYHEVLTSTLRLYTNSAATAFVRGSIHFRNGLVLQVFEHIDSTDGELLDCSYSVYDSEEKILWYDPQPHRENPELSVTFPHHFHSPPDIKHNRHPAHGISFELPNLPTLIADCVRLKG